MAARPSAAAAAALKNSLRGCAPVFAALGDETRLQLIVALGAGGAVSIAQLVSGTRANGPGAPCAGGNRAVAGAGARPPEGGLGTLTGIGKR
jgi:hypothetical protein